MDGSFFKGVEILYEDNHLLVVIKPVNMPMQADASGDTDLLSLLKEYRRVHENKPGEAWLGLVHRLDRPTGGICVFAKTSKAASRLSDQIRTNRLIKEYHCVVEGRFQELTGAYQDWLLKDHRQNQSIVTKSQEPGAKLASLDYQVLFQTATMVLVKVRLYTGRSHQIRVQFAAHGHPLWGDHRYGHGQSHQQLALWASSLTFAHPVSKEELTFTAPLPDTEPWNLF